MVHKNVPASEKYVVKASSYVKFVPVQDLYEDRADVAIGAIIAYYDRTLVGIFIKPLWLMRLLQSCRCVTTYEYTF